MSTGEFVTAIILFITAALLAVIAVRSFLEKGFLFNNAYIYASKRERETMDKRPYYRQSAVIFGLLSAVFVVIGLSLVFQNDLILLLEIPLMAAALIYAAVSTVRINKRR